ncbi:MAG: hypothetical protein GXO02_04920 [Epsilonproteobacteria bacterium]|nr:hypothetical protein [Campylobacterota bacterium]
MKRILFIISFVTLLNGEPSVYSNSSYIDPVKLAKRNSSKIVALKGEIEKLKVEIEGLKSLLEGISAQLNNLRNQNGNNILITQLAQRVAKLESAILNGSSITQQKTLPSNKNISYSENLKQKRIEKKRSLEDIFKEAVLNFNKKRFTKAKRDFLELKKKRYKLASVEFYLGEIAFFNKRYQKAFEHYQRSVQLNENSAFIDKLLYHTAISLYHLNRKREAKKFLLAVIDGYPNTPSAREAKKYLKKRF